jgi:hypothetical protein
LKCILQIWRSRSELVLLLCLLLLVAMVVKEGERIGGFELGEWVLKLNYRVHP